MTSTCSPSPLLQGILADRAREAIRRIARELPETLETPDLADGEAGLAVCFAALDRWEPGRGYLDRAERHVEAALNQISSRPIPPGLFQGLAGVAWTLRNLGVENLDELLEGIDAALLGWAAHPALSSDRVEGLVGLGVYALSGPATPTLQALLEKVVTRLVDQADGLWFTPPERLNSSQRECFPLGCIDLGPAHGLPGPLGFLGMARSRLGDQAEALTGKVESAMQWLLHQRNAPVESFAFPPMLSPPPVITARDAHPCRIGWCYGDLGLGYSLLRLADDWSRADWREIALEVLRLAAQRPLERAGMHDACLCHGSAGNAHLFHRLWRATEEPLFAEAAQAYFRWTLDFQQSGLGVGGFSKRIAPTRDGSPGWAPVPGLLVGAAGVALALMSAVSDSDTGWDGFFLDPLRKQEQSIPAPGC